MWDRAGERGECRESGVTLHESSITSAAEKLFLASKQLRWRLNDPHGSEGYRFRIH